MAIQTLFFCIICLMFEEALASVQFYEQSSNLALALSTGSNSSCTDLFFQISAPTSAGWGAVGIGDQMAGAMMFILVPSASTGE
ncbi:MAG: hypothetical protein LQ340_002910 [Diploschistes diacapsis]|nr:MAG: hypothetical protein LQ340_002910 [Diploschistes diacapsis]